MRSTNFLNIEGIGIISMSERRKTGKNRETVGGWLCRAAFF
jgi:hypothetical protein